MTLPRRGNGRGNWRALLLLAVLAAPLLLTACGRKNWPKPPGPPDQIIYPRQYPSR